MDLILKFNLFAANVVRNTYPLFFHLLHKLIQNKNIKCGENKNISKRILKKNIKSY